MAKLRGIKGRTNTFLKRIRQQAQDANPGAGKITEDDAVDLYNPVNDADLRRIKRRAMRLFERMHSSTGIYYLSEENGAA